MIYEIRLKGRQKQGECSGVLTMTFLIIALSVFSLNLIPLVYVSVVKPLLSGQFKEKASALVVSLLLLLTLRVVLSCLSFGSDRFMLKRAENHIAGAGDIFYYFMPSKFVSLWGFSLKFSTYKLIIMITTSFPFLLCSFICYLLCVRGFSAAVCSIFALFSVVFLFLGISAYMRISDTLFLVRYRYIKGDFLNFRQLISQSQEDMQGRLQKLRSLKGSFVGWFLLSLLIVPLPYVWAYYRQTKACFAAE